jgi:hypothetical protein
MRAMEGMNGMLGESQLKLPSKSLHKLFVVGQHFFRLLGLCSRLLLNNTPWSQCLEADFSTLEALGAVTNICSDKTGTLTQGKMIVKQAWVASLGHFFRLLGLCSRLLLNNTPWSQCLEADFSNCRVEWSLANLAHVYKKKHEDDEGDRGNEWHARGEPTEIAIQVFASTFGECHGLFLGIIRVNNGHPLDIRIKRKLHLLRRGR